MFGQGKLREEADGTQTRQDQEIDIYYKEIYMKKMPDEL